MSVLAMSAAIKVNAALLFICIHKLNKGYLHVYIRFYLYAQTRPEKDEIEPGSVTNVGPPPYSEIHMNI
jgi:hypothetical protein